MLLAIAGKFPVSLCLTYAPTSVHSPDIPHFSQGDYVDGRFNDPSETTGLDANLGRMPIVSVGDVNIGQSTAMYFYVAASHGLMGEGFIEMAQVLSIHEHIKEMRAAYNKLVPYESTPTADNLDLWFEGGAKDVSGIADGAASSSRYLTWYLGRIENTLGDQGFAVGNKLSLADVQLYYCLSDFLRAEDATPEVAQWDREPFASKARTDAAVARHPKIKASIDAVLANANVQKWLATRGVQEF